MARQGSYLHPAYQAPDQPQAALALPTQAAPATAATTGTGPQAWPTELAQQMQVLRDALQQAARPLHRSGSGWLPARAAREGGAAADDLGRAQLGAADG